MQRKVIHFLEKQKVCCQAISSSLWSDNGTGRIEAEKNDLCLCLLWDYISTVRA